MGEQRGLVALAGFIALISLVPYHVSTAFLPAAPALIPSKRKEFDFKRAPHARKGSRESASKREECAACEARDCPTPELTPDVYTKWRESELGNLTESIERQLMLELVGNELEGKSVLEIGCGDGNLVVELSKASYGLGRIHAVDASKDMVDAAKRHASDHGAEVSFSVAMAQELPFADEQFDVVVAQTILCFVKDPLSVFREINRVLRPEGTLVIGELGKWSIWALERRLKAMRGSSLWRKGIFRTPEELRSLALSVGLVPSRVTGAVYYPRSIILARVLAPFDRLFSRISHVGAAFLAMKASKGAKR